MKHTELKLGFFESNVRTRLVEFKIIYFQIELTTFYAMSVPKSSRIPELN